MTAVGPSLPIGDVRFDGEFRRDSGLDVLTLSFVEIDPQQTSPRAGFGIPERLSSQAPRPFACPCKCVRAEQETLDYRSTSQCGSR